MGKLAIRDQVQFTITIPSRDRLNVSVCALAIPLCTALPPHGAGHQRLRSGDESEMRCKALKSGSNAGPQCHEIPLQNLNSATEATEHEKRARDGKKNEMK